MSVTVNGLQHSSPRHEENSHFLFGPLFITYNKWGEKITVLIYKRDSGAMFNY